MTNKKPIGVVYKITNIINNKIYIGITTITAQKRWKQHINTAYNLNAKDSQSPFKKAIRKYTPENFKIEIIDEEYNSKEELKQKEIKWIKYYNSCCFDKNGWGYNCTRGEIIAMNDYRYLLLNAISYLDKLLIYSIPLEKQKNF